MTTDCPLTTTLFAIAALCVAAAWSALTIARVVAELSARTHRALSHLWESFKEEMKNL